MQEYGKDFYGNWLQATELPSQNFHLVFLPKLQEHYLLHERRLARTDRISWLFSLLFYLQ